MNELIQQLSEQAENYAAEQNDKFGVSYKKTYNQKFAELIAQDCISQIALYGISNFENDDIVWAVERSIEIIKERFMELKNE